MSSSAFKPDSPFPNLELPPGRPEPAKSANSLSPWVQGNRVFAPWSAQYLHAGLILRIQGDRALINFDDGDEGWVNLNQLEPLIVRRGQSVVCMQKSGLSFFPAEVLDFRDNVVRLRFKDTGQEDWETLEALGIPNPRSGPAAFPTKVLSQPRFRDKLKRGSRVLAPWAADALYAGTVALLRGEEALIHFDDGYQGWALVTQVMPLIVPAGLRILTRRDLTPYYYPGKVQRCNGEELFIAYEDGATGWVSPSDWCIPFQPGGRPARPAGAGILWEVLTSPAWIVILFLLGMWFFRSG